MSKKTLGLKLTLSSDATVLQIERLEPQVAFEGIGERLNTSIAHKRIAVDGNPAYAEHGLEVVARIPQTVFPRLVVPLERLHLDQCGQDVGAFVAQQTRREVDAVQAHRVLDILADHLNENDKR